MQGPVLLLLLLLLLVEALASPGPAPVYCGGYGPCKPPPPPPRDPHKYLPAPPGKTPRCAKPGSTFCETADHYPAHLVQYLVDRWAFDFNTFLKNEGAEDFNFRSPVMYGPPQSSYNSSRGYPNRRYRLDPSHTSFTYPPPRTEARPGGEPLLDIGLTPPVSSEQWWNRPRRRRQTPGAEGVTTLCPTASRFVAPQAALNNQGNWMFVANVPEVDQRLTQLVRAETCVSSQCSGICSLPAGYSSRCEQQFVQKRLVALGGAGDRLYTDTFWFPHCCVCQITPASGAG